MHVPIFYSEEVLYVFACLNNKMGGKGPRSRDHSLFFEDVVLQQKEGELEG